MTNETEQERQLRIQAAHVAGLEASNTQPIAPPKPRRTALASCAAWHQEEADKHSRSHTLFASKEDANTSNLAWWHRQQASLHLRFAAACREADGL